ncbi:MAG: 2-amino-4-hydroxy-6-hydroxymethyldihydropteridine diphosphokinase [Pirellulales bacterium]|nr:2-amino-4-hydroxy-6-hydroxymethyldihydropteridine diphosphokinase [Pirellulales bacterium]MDA7975573.1 2-amino-4-hydroxy-6-hydroxymethyldihydropteridine diphosphokinase [Pirellulales bacterium]MDA7993718.1 2-amino-4-hydroxy-6-hydroxymethyldihydropteridine diphosphokinase [Pirellulales bacterium]MDA8041357.1 2-amino-4-hydroxy-6-hydroxymethyldihydropteridine diphosphokinase [Pirellulales bacterium]
MVLEANHQKTANCLIGCGANEGARREQLNQAIDMLRFMPGVRLVDVSQFLETLPVGGPPGQSPYLNAACLIETTFKPAEVLDMLLAVENTLHRSRETRWGPRTIDLDLLLYDDCVLKTECLQVPHPRMTTRRFVLEPAAAIAADLKHPVAGCTIRELLENISERHLHVAVVGVPGSGAPEIADAVADVTLSRLIHAPAPLPLSSFGAPNGEQSAIKEEPVDQLLLLSQKYAAPLLKANWPVDPHGTVTDYWIESIRLAAQTNSVSDTNKQFENAFATISQETVVPNVILLLNVNHQTLSERIAYRTHSAQQSDIFSDLVAVQTMMTTDQGIHTLLTLQERLVNCLLHNQETQCRPKAVIQLDSDDLGKAAFDAVAAIEGIS